MADVRFSILFGPPSLDASAMGFPPQEPLAPGGYAVATVIRPVVADLPVRRRHDLGEPIGGWFAWRLMASNNRRLGSGVASYPSRSRTVSVITALQHNLDLLQAKISTDRNNGTWRWRAEFDGIAVAVCPHWYERERDCRTGYAKFLAAVAHARVAQGGTVLRDHRPGYNISVPRHRPADPGRRRPWPTY